MKQTVAVIFFAILLFTFPFALFGLAEYLLFLIAATVIIGFAYFLAATVFDINKGV